MNQVAETVGAFNEPHTRDAAQNKDTREASQTCRQRGFIEHCVLAQLFEGTLQEKKACNEKEKAVKKHQPEPHEHW